MAHISVLLNECLEAFAGCSIARFVDGTLGAGGHALAILEAHPEIEEFIGFDQDPAARAIAKKRLARYENKLTIVPKNFATMQQELAGKKADGILLDIGVSSMQLDEAERGFSFMRDGPLDMRMNPENPLTAAEIVNTRPVNELSRIFKLYGEEPKAFRAAKLIEQARSLKAINTTLELAEALKTLYPPYKKGIHPLTLVFQALRIVVNDELGVLKSACRQALNCLNPGGVLAIITFHSLEDRIVKNIFRHAASDKENTSGIGGLFLDKDPEVDLVTRKAVVASGEEIAANPRSRSAKLRVVRKR